MTTTKLFCLPYAGGSITVFNRWYQYLKHEIDLIPIELAGRGRRIGDKLYGTLDDAVDDVFDIICNQLISADYALFGHSMGSLISFKLAHKIKINQLPDAKHLFFSGRGAPHVYRADRKKYHLMNDAEFKKELLLLGGMIPEFFEHQELLELFLPMLRNDFRIVETDVFNSKVFRKPFDTNITIFLGEEEDVNLEQRNGWREYTHHTCTMHDFCGGHFFLNNAFPEMIDIINKTL